jgi:hypothetical protein
MADRFELRIQKAICDSYAHYGGWAEKWDNAHKKGRPDLICMLPAVGTHFHEVKHRPNIKVTDDAWPVTIDNPLSRKQREIARKMNEGGGWVSGLLAIGSGTMLNIQIALFAPDDDHWLLSGAVWVPYKPKIGFDVRGLV